jgi:phage-related protein
MQVIFFNKKVEKFFNSIEEQFKPRLRKTFELLEERNAKLEMPHSKPLGRGLFELRIMGTSHIRFIHAFHLDIIWILHGFIKKTNKIPKGEISYAQRQLKLLLQ